MDVLLILLIIIFLILLISVGASFEYGEGDIKLALKVGPFRFKLLPKEEKAKPEKPKKEKEKPKKEKFRPDKDFIPAMLRMVLKALGRFRRKLNVDEVAIHYAAAAGNPYDTAMQFGFVSAAAGAMLPLLDKALKIRNRDIRISADFDADSPVIFVHVAATLLIWEWLYIALLFAIEFLILKIKLRRQAAHRERKKNNGQTSRERADGSDDDKAQGDGGRQHHRRRAHNHAG